jgi:hypothetical protein
MVNGARRSPPSAKEIPHLVVTRNSRWAPTPTVRVARVLNTEVLQGAE